MEKILCLGVSDLCANFALFASKKLAILTKKQLIYECIAGDFRV